MGKLKIFVHALLVATSPALFVYPQTPSAQQTTPEILKGTFSYDDVLHLLDEIESGAIQNREEQELDQINQFLSHLAREGKLPTDNDEELENDPSQQKPYVVQMKDGKAFDKKGNLIEGHLPEAHIPLEEFVYRE